jgi:hypothetical protein
MTLQMLHSDFIVYEENFILFFISAESGRMPEFAGKVVLVTGASSGIGEGTARYLASLGAR